MSGRGAAGCLFDALFIIWALVFNVATLFCLPFTCRPTCKCIVSEQFGQPSFSIFRQNVDSLLPYPDSKTLTTMPHLFCFLSRQRWMKVSRRQRRLVSTMDLLPQKLNRQRKHHLQRQKQIFMRLGATCSFFSKILNLKTLDTIGYCQRPVFSLGVSQKMHKVTNL